MSAPTLAWTAIPAKELGRLVWQRGRQWPFPLDSAGVAQWQPSLANLLAVGDGGPGPSAAPEAEALLRILAAPGYCAYLIRCAAGVESHYAAIAGAGEVVVVLDTGDAVHLANVADTYIAATLATRLPRVSESSEGPVELSPRRATALESSIGRGDPVPVVRSAMAAAGIPLAVADRLLDGASGVSATGLIGAVTYAADGPRVSPRQATWSETTGGAVLSTRNRSGHVVWQSMSAVAVAHAVAEALAGLN